MSAFANTQTGSTFSVDQTGLVQDTERLLSPQLRIVPDGSPILVGQDGQNKCSICWGSYAESVESGNGCAGGGPRILSCSHVFGRDCIIDSMLAGNNNSCPICRKLFHLREAGKFFSQGIMDDLKAQIEFNAGIQDPVNNDLSLLAREAFHICLIPTYNFVELTMDVASRDPILTRKDIIIYGLGWIITQTVYVVAFAVWIPFVASICILIMLRYEIRRIPLYLRRLLSFFTRQQHITYYLGMLILVSVVNFEVFLRWAGPWRMLEIMFPPDSRVWYGYSWIIDQIFGVGMYVASWNDPQFDMPELQ
ncbi:uncharacterized protein RAG0_00012 [Rhynchosporium agropyri]|uniref:RING-type domain-containing protein n=1 Tax=Rhynchosporium agropyri TaxID=914238 RepID=A0A1E1JVL9_9HELO|nr:uncharacterized protein RAG0_00012 [Rhynchosporium agropyri]